MSERPLPVLSKQERAYAAELMRAVAAGIPEEPRMVLAALHLATKLAETRKHLDVRERALLADFLRLAAAAYQKTYGLQHIPTEHLYRKVTGVDRATGDPPPWPSLFAGAL